MTSRDFAFWLQGFFELTNQKTLDEKQVDMIKKHLNLVFVHEIDPSLDNGDSKKVNYYNDIHGDTALRC